MKLPNDFELSINNEKLKQVSSTKYLGLFFDENLNWKLHISYIKNKIAKAIGVFYKLSKLCCLKILKQIYYSIVFPHLYYGINCWGCSYDTNIKPIQIQQNRILRIILSLPPLTHTNLLYRELKLLKVKEIFKQQTFLFVYRYSHSLLPPAFNNYFTLVSSTHQYNTRHSQSNYMLPMASTNYGARSPSAMAIKLWREIDVVGNYTYIKFKKHIYENLLVSYL